MTPMRTQRRSVLTAAGVAVALVLVLAACDDSAEPTAAGDPSTTVPASSTTSTTVAPAAEGTAPEQVAREFVEAYGAFDADEALTYLTQDAIATGAGYTGTWGSPDAFRSHVSLAQGMHIYQTVTGCENQGESGDGVAVRCAFDFHELRSDEIGRGPYTGSSWDLVVSDGKITYAWVTWVFLTNGSSAEMWQPFQAWVTSTHPEDLQTLYPVGDPVPTEETIRLWDERTREWAEEVNASSE
jgi:hypothetical protein